MGHAACAYASTLVEGVPAMMRDGAQEVEIGILGAVEFEASLTLVHELNPGRHIAEIASANAAGVPGIDLSRIA
jgi:hypothetical protein